MHLYFDLDGTLFETEPVVLAASRAFCEEFRRPYPGDPSVLSKVGRPLPEFLENLLGAPADEAATRRYNETECAEVLRNGRLFEGAKAALMALKTEGHTLFVLSNGVMEYIELVLSATGVRPLFAALYTAGNSPSKAHKLREVLPPNTPAAFVRDTVDDLKAARENNLPHIAALYGYGGEDAYDSFSYLARSPADIPAIVRRLCDPAS